MKTFVLPDLGEGLQEAEIVAWLVAPGDRVVIDQPLVSVETDKAVVEIPSPRSGRVAKLHAAKGDVLRVGAPLVDFDDVDAVADAGTVVGEISRPPELGTPASTQALAPRSPAERAAPRSGGGVRPVAPVRKPETAVARAKAAPAVRALAHRLGVALETLRGTGPHGSVTTGDVEQAASGRNDEPLHGTRRAMALNMERAHAAVARTTVVDEADIECWGADQDPTARLVRAICRAVLCEPALNAWYDAATMCRVLNDTVDLGIAVDTKDGLFVPVLRDAGALDTAEIRAAVMRFRHTADEHGFKPQDLHGATITLSNFGMIAGRFAALMVVPPQVAIVGAGRIERRVVAGANGPEVHRSMPLSLTFDHRAVFGAEAARFLRAVMTDLANAQ